MVLLPLPLSPARATISRSPISRLTSSTACRVRRASAFPILKCLLSPSVRSSGAAPAWADSSLMAAAFVGGHAPRGAAGGPAAHAVGGGAGGGGSVAEVLGWLVGWPMGRTVQQAADLHRADEVEVGWRGQALVHHLGAARREAAARRGAGQVGRGARDAGQRQPGPADRGERVQQAGAVRVLRGVEDLPGRAELGHL